MNNNMVLENDEENHQTITKMDIYKNHNALAALLCAEQIIEEDDAFVFNMCVALEAYEGSLFDEANTTLIPVVADWLSMYQNIARSRIVGSRTTRRYYVCGPLYSPCVGGSLDAPLDVPRWNWWYDRFIALGGSDLYMRRFPVS